MYVKFSKLLRAKILICLVFLLLLSHGVCFGSEVEELRKDLLELEKIVNPFVRIFQKVSRLVAPSVVSIVAEGAYGTATNPHDEESPLSSPDGENNKSQDSNKPSFGSGIVIKETGYILTNFHVVSDFENGKITVTLHNGDKHDAVLIGQDPNTDLAILKIECNDLREATLGDPESVNVGD